MEIKTEADINGDVARKLREQSGLTQRVFWNSLGLTQSGGCRYEGGHAIPKPVRILLFAVYVAGLKIEAGSKEGADELRRLATLQTSMQAESAEIIGAKVAQAMGAVKQAARLLQSIA